MEDHRKEREDKEENAIGAVRGVMAKSIPLGR